MKSHASSPSFIYLLVLSITFYSTAVFAQDAGIGTFSDLVGEALQTSSHPQPSPVVTTVLRRNFAGGTEAVTTTQAPPFFSTPIVGLEYDYRRTQQKAPGGLTIDINEAHSSFSFALASTNLAFDCVHIWSEGSNDVGGRQSIASNGIKMTVTQLIGNQLIFSLPLFYKDDDGDALTSTGAQTFGVDTFAMNPLLIFSVKLPILKDARGEPKPSKDQSLALSLSSGYRLGVTQKHDIRPVSPDIDGWTGTFNLLAGFEYAPKNDEGENKWKISGSATWNHLARFYSSKTGPRPDDNGFGLGASFAYNLLTSKETHQSRVTVKIAYQYDGFNQDSYQHSVAVAGTYRF